MKITIVGGAGKMGRWFGRLLAGEGFEVILADRDQVRLEEVRRELGVRSAALEEAVTEADVLLLAVTIDQFPSMVTEIAPFVRENQIVADVTSIKAAPLAEMQRAFKTRQIIGTHPVFGPGAKDFNSQNFVLTPTNETEASLAEKVKPFLEARGARVVVMSPQEHDQMMAVVLGLSHFISIVAADTLATLGRLPQMKHIGGSTYRVLSTLVESVISEDPELYATLQMNLPGLVEIEGLFQRNAARWANYVKTGDKTAFKAGMSALKEKFAENDADFGQAYRNMYKIMEWL